MFEELSERRIATVAVEEHISAGDQRKLHAVGLRFEDGLAVVFRGGSDGCSLVSERGELREFDMAEAGRVAVSDGSRWLPAGATVADVQPLVDRDGVTFGVVMQTTPGGRIFIYNWGDELYLGDSLPPHVQAEVG